MPIDICVLLCTLVGSFSAKQLFKAGLTSTSHIWSRQTGVALNEAWKLQEVLRPLPLPYKASQTLQEPGFHRRRTEEPPLR